jgi:2-dehydropantoate 2-reductase
VGYNPESLLWKTKPAEVTMRIAVIGTGGVGGYFGGRLALAGEEVIFIARGDHLQALQTDGLRVESINGDFTLRNVRAARDPAEVGPVDAVLVAVKAWQVAEVAGAMRPLVGLGTAVVPLENGVEAPAQLAAVLGRDAVLGGLCQIVSFIAGPGHIRHTGIDPYIAFAELDGRPSQRAESLRVAFERAGVRAEIPADIHQAMWDKFMFISAFGGVGAVTRAPAGPMRSVPETRQMLKAALAEVVAVAQAHGVSLEEAAVERKLAFIDGLPEGTTASMQRDIIAGRVSELESQSGAVVRLGAERGVVTPTHRFIYQSLLPQELRARGKLDF